MRLVTDLLRAVIKSLTWLLHAFSNNKSDRPSKERSEVNTVETLLDDFELKGFWWLPDAPENKISGTLNFRGSAEISLDLLGSFQMPGSSGVIEQQDLILGFSQDGRKITVYDSFVSSSEIKMPGILNTTYTSNYLFFGKHYTNPSEIIFNKCMCSFSYLEQWLAKRVYKTEPIKKDCGGISGFTFNYLIPEEKRINIPAIEAELSFVSRFTTKNDNFNSFTCSHTSYVEIEPKIPKDFKWHLNKIIGLQSIMTFFVGEPAKVRRVRCTPLDSEKEQVEMFFLNSTFDEKDKVSPFDMFFAMPQIPNIDVALNNWFAKSDQLNEVFDLYFGTIYHPHSYLNFNFLALTQAFESYHRNMVGGHYLDRDTYIKSHYDSMVKAIPAGIENGFRQSLKKRLEFGYELSLRKRLTDTIKSMDEQLQKLFIGNFKRDTFIGKVINTRNYFTHFDNTTADDVAHGSDLYALNVKLSYLIAILILKELEVSDQHILNAFKQYRKFINFRFH
jgi:hypothetical protein